MELRMPGKLPGAGTTIFTVMSRLAQQHQAINLSQGFPDFDGPRALLDRVAHHLRHGHNQYAPLHGVGELCEQIAAKVHDLYGCRVDPELEVTVTPGATEALFCAVTAVVSAGDEAIVFDPAYDTYEPAVKLNGGVTRHIPMRYPDFRIDWQQVRDSINDKTRLIILNMPHNPSGSNWRHEDVEALRGIVNDTGVFLLSDEVYEHIVFDGARHLSLLRYPDLAERSFTVFSFGKTYHATGWRIGYCVAPRALMAEFLKIHQFINFSTNTPMQYALADFLRDHPQHHKSLADFYQRKRDLFCDLMRPSRFRFKPAEGTFFQLLDYSEITREADTSFARRLTTRHGVATIPVSVFYRSPPDQHILRICFAKREKTLQRAAERLLEI